MRVNEQGRGSDPRACHRRTAYDVIQPIWEVAIATSAGTPNVDLAELRQQARALTDFAVNPQVIELLEEIEASPDPIAAADELATVDELRRRGIDISDDLRLTLRYFESADDVEGHERVIWAPVAETAD